MSNSNGNPQETQITKDMIIIQSTTQQFETPTPKGIRICWNTGEEKNCPACYLSKGCKAKA